MLPPSRFTGLENRYIQPGQPRQNAQIERYNRVRHWARTNGAFNGSIRHEWIDQYNIETIEEAQDRATQWPRTCGNDRPNSGKGGVTPAQKLKMAA